MSKPAAAKSYLTSYRTSHRTLRLIGGLVGALSLSLGACTYTSTEVVATIPDDYKIRHPIAIEEGRQSIVVFVGNDRGGLTAPQRNDIAGLARSWLREGTGAVVADVPVDTPNARAAADTYREIRAMLTAGGVPAHAIKLHNYQPEDPRLLAAIRLSYPKIQAVAGPCGLWPDDLGPNLNNPGYSDNQHYQNFGCATQRNLAAMIDNPADLEQPRSESAAYTPRRSAAFEKYRKGESTSISYPDADKAKLSDVGK
ncbi:putative pilus assembly protein cpaD [Bradyrhizobium sp. STM 3843]|uniref:CpaD family pilus assembly protein n=1 Tax=Bradyrhizobium sp. STM 3843 TaxID=551947 RepID=UPI0002406699|nr:CpaD family pilus assembly protein [Bradyrhizobium sp. STM 3843]CCE04757.1 putative pilus assembly protein cpaD [Bradyrhizobium sp. STM 3843]